MLNNLPGRNYDILVGNECGKIIVAGECALQRCGLTTLVGDTIKAWTLHVGINGGWNPIAQWYFNPLADVFTDTIPSIRHPSILEPTQERALVEYIIFRDYFSEGILIEGLKTYMFRHDNNLDALYRACNTYHLPKDWLDYWIKEAIEDVDDP